MTEQQQNWLKDYVDHYDTHVEYRAYIKHKDDGKVWTHHIMPWTSYERFLEIIGDGELVELNGHKFEN